jgi:structural maintenance of chromosome 2
MRCANRSLIKLSLILALPQFKPALTYTLDKIDVTQLALARNLSHTRYIGMLFRARFCGAQFVVVLLKEVSSPTQTLFFFRTCLHIVVV